MTILVLYATYEVISYSVVISWYISFKKGGNEMEDIPPYLNFKIKSSCDLWKKDDVMWNNCYGVLLGVLQFVFASNKVTDEKLLVVYIRKCIRSLS